MATHIAYHDDYKADAKKRQGKFEIIMAFYETFVKKRCYTILCRKGLPQSHFSKNPYFFFPIYLLSPALVYPAQFSPGEKNRKKLFLFPMSPVCYTLKEQNLSDKFQFSLV